MTEAESKKMESLEQQVASLEAQIDYLVGVLDIKAPYCDECEYRDELVEEPEEGRRGVPTMMIGTAALVGGAGKPAML